MLRARLTWVSICLALLAAVVAPSLYLGARDLQAARGADAAARYAEAAAAYADAARLMPYRRDLWEPAGLAAYRAGDAEGAIRFLQLAARRAPLSVDGSVSLGSALSDQGQTSDALAVWNQGLKNHPAAPALLDRLIAAYDEQGDYADEQSLLLQRLANGNHAAANYRLGLLLMPTDSVVAATQLSYAAGLDSAYAPAVATLKAALQVAGAEPDPALRMVVIGRGLGLVGEWRLARHAFEQATQSDPGQAEAWAWLGESQQHLGQDGRLALDRALQLGPADALVHALRALYWRRQDDFSAALAEQLQAAQLEPQSASMQSALGDAYVAAGDLVSALAAYQQATALAPADAGTWRQLAAFSAGNGVRVEDVGLPAALKAAALAPRDASTLDVLGWTYTRAGRPYTGKETLLQAIALDPGLALAHLHLAEIFLQIGDYPAASAQLSQASDLDPNGPVGQAARQLLAQYFP